MGSGAMRVVDLTILQAVKYVRPTMLNKLGTQTNLVNSLKLQLINYLLIMKVLMIVDVDVDVDDDDAGL